MARNGSGTYSLPQAPFVSGTTISSTAVNSDFSDIATALTQSIASDGQTAITANLPMTGYAHTNVANSTARNMYAATGQVQDSAFIWCGTAGGTADALTLTPTPAITTYAAGQVFRFTAGASPNTGAATVAISGLTAQAIQSGGSALAAGAIEAGKQYELVYDGTQFQIRAYSLTALRITGSSYQNVAANATTNLAAINASTVAINLTGNATIDTFSGLSGLPELRLKLGGAAINITNGANISVPGGNYTGAANDTLVLRPTGNTTAEVVDIMRANGTPVVSGGSSALAYLGEQTANNSATLDFSANISSTYDEYIFKMYNVVPESQGTTLRLRVSVDGGSTFQASTYGHTSIYSQNANATLDVQGASGTANATSLSGAGLTLNNATGKGISGTICIRPNGSGIKTGEFQVSYRETGDTNAIAGSGGFFWNNTTTVNGVRFFISTGNITAGTIRMYGVAKA